MEMKLNAAIAAAYMPCKITDKYANGVHYDMVGVSQYEGMLQCKMPSGDSDWWNIDICQLILTPLREITKVQASDIALFFKKDYHTYFAVSDVCIVYSDTAKEGYNILQISFDALSTNLAGHSEINKYKVCIGNWGSIFVYYNGALSATNEARHIIAYCQRNSIDVGYGDIPSLIAAGIAIQG